MRAPDAAAPDWYADKQPPPRGAGGGAGSGASLRCSTCATTSTPMWRRDAAGAMLCNACGLRARRAAAAAARHALAEPAAGRPWPAAA